MIKGIIGFIKWWWKDDLFSDKESGNPILVSFEQADAVAEKLSQRLEDKTWIGGIGIIPDEKYGHVVRVGIDPEILQIKPEQFDDFCFTQIVDGVQVRFVPEAMGVAYKKHGK